MSAFGYKLVLLGIIVTFSSWETVVTAQGDPAHVVVVNSSKLTLNENETFWMYINVTGNPDPVTTLFAISTGKVIFRKTKKGYFNITMPSLNCSDTGLYELTCDNQLANTSKTKSLSVLCSPEPDPNYPIVSTITPRLHTNINLTLHATGYPTPKYQWFHNGTRLHNHTDTNYTTMLILNDLSVHNYGEYVVLMRNSLGNDSVLFSVKADGPPDPVTDLDVSNITETTAYLTFTTGYDYNNTQTFVVQRDMNGTLIDFRNLSDLPSDYGGRKEVLVITELEEFTDYNLTIVSRNIRGESISRGVFVHFTTKGEKPAPNPKYPLTKLYKPRLRDEVTLTIHALHRPKFHWMHNGKDVKSRVILEESDFTIESVDVDDFGDYILLMTNPAGNYTVVYSLLAEGPPEPVSHIKVANVSINSANIIFTTGYDYNDTQTFIITDKYSNLSSCEDTTSGKGSDPFACALYNLKEDTIYNITVVSSNSRGESKPNSEFVAFTTYGVPKPNPAIKSTYIFSPRIPDDVNMTIHAVGYPPPKFEWWHNGTSLNSSDTNYTSSLAVKILDGKDFGKYVLNMTNKVGNSSMVYQVLAEGPPDAVSNLEVSNITETSANITFTSGYDYNDTQTFVVLNYTNGNATELTSVNGTTHDDGGTTVRIYLNELKPVSNYNLTAVARNSRGQSKPHDAFWYFETLGKPAPDPSYKDNVTDTPRLGANVKLLFHAVGNPLPTFQWYHGYKPLGNTTTGNMASLTLKNFNVSDFGTYLLNMRNDRGETNVTFSVKADGPPDPVRDLVAGEVTSDSVQLYWRPGFNYGSNQTFTIYQVGNEKELQGKIEDTTKGNFSMNETYALTGLSDSTTYTVYIMAINEHGKASQYSNSVNFTTSDSDDGGTTAEIVGYVVGGIGFVVLILVIISLIRCYIARRGYLYGNLDNQQNDEGEERPREPHNNRYDDAADT